MNDEKTNRYLWHAFCLLRYLKNDLIKSVNMNRCISYHNAFYVLLEIFVSANLSIYQIQELFGTTYTHIKLDKKWVCRIKDAMQKTFYRIVLWQYFSCARLNQHFKGKCYISSRTYLVTDNVVRIDIICALSIFLNEII